MLQSLLCAAPPQFRHLLFKAHPHFIPPFLPPAACRPVKSYFLLMAGPANVDEVPRSSVRFKTGPYWRLSLPICSLCRTVDDSFSGMEDSALHQMCSLCSAANLANHRLGLAYASRIDRAPHKKAKKGLLVSDFAFEPDASAFPRLKQELHNHDSVNLESNTLSARPTRRQAVHTRMHLKLWAQHRQALWSRFPRLCRVSCVSSSSFVLNTRP